MGKKLDQQVHDTQVVRIPVAPFSTAIAAQFNRPLPTDLVVNLDPSPSAVPGGGVLPPGVTPPPPGRVVPPGTKVTALVVVPPIVNPGRVYGA